jgi:CSLREA domain-containing protein
MLRTVIFISLLVLFFVAFRVEVEAQEPLAVKRVASASVKPDAVITVNTLADTVATDGLCSLREAIQSAYLAMPIGSCASGAVGADTINITVTGTIVLGSALPDIAQEVTIAGPGAELLTISGNNACRVLKANAGAKVNLSGLTLANGYVLTTGGGGLLNSGIMTLTDSIVYNNTAFGVNGGGIFNEGRLTLSNTAVYSNSSAGGSFNGGGIYGRSTITLPGTLTLINSTVYSNSAQNNGGGMYLSLAALTLANSNVHDNHAVSYGGGLVINASTLTMTNSSLYANTAVRGGGIYSINDSTLKISASAFYNNSATLFNAGGIDFAESGTQNATLTNTTFYSNTAVTGGGAIYVTLAGTTLNVINSTFAMNKAPGSIYVNAGTVILKNTLVANNPAGANCYGAIIDGGNNLQYGGTVASSCGATIPTANPQLAPFGNYGGATDTMALYAGSAAIDAGNPATCAATDQRGVARPVGPVCDIGSYEGALPAAYLPFVGR